MIIQALMRCNYFKRNASYGETLNFEGWKDFQNRVTESKHAPVHVVDAPKLDEN